MINKSGTFFLLALFAILYLMPLPGQSTFFQNDIQQRNGTENPVLTGERCITKSNNRGHIDRAYPANWLRPAVPVMFGNNTFAARCLSSLAIGLTALVIFSLCFHCRGCGEQIPWLAVFVYLTLFGVAIIGTAGVLNALLSLFYTATVTCFFLATEEQPSLGKQWPLLLAAGLFAGCAFIIGGVPAVVGPVLIAGPYLLLQGRWHFIVPELGLGPYLVLKGRMADTLRLFWLPVVGAVLIGLPWAMALPFQGHGFHSLFLSGLNDLTPFFSAGTTRNPHRLISSILPVMFMPWILLVPAALAGWRKRKEQKTARDRLFCLCVCWFLFTIYFIFLSGPRGVFSMLPCFPPLAILMSLGLGQLRQCDEKGMQYLQRGIGVAILLVFIILPALTEFYPMQSGWMQYLGNSWRESLFVGIPATLMLTIALRIRRVEWKIRVFALSFVLFPVLAHLT
ncbi:MAG TPA: phospholipid carrier-dependent glycosyltransferase [Desulfobulbaceae bacterium]|nr:phospholipid carrier-dependent glycosyltransferase [Desulfobulbaceae bacterium]